MVNIPTNNTTNSPTNFTEIAPANIEPVIANHIHQRCEKGSFTRVLNLNMAATEAEIKNNKIGSNRMYLLRAIMPISNISRVEAIKLADRFLVRSHTEVNANGMMKTPMRVQPPRMPHIG